VATQVKTQHLPTRHDYFSTDTGNLYYVVEIIDGGDFLIEDCKTLDMVWIRRDAMEGLDYSPVAVSQKGGAN
jgi:hypothetical protein